jgi:hypothetical protein
MKHIRTFNEAAEDSPLFWRVEGEEWLRVLPRFPTSSHLPIDKQLPVMFGETIKVMKGRATTTQPVTTKEAELYLGMINDVISSKGTPEISICFFSVTDQDTRDLYSVTCGERGGHVLYPLTSAEMSDIISDGTVELHGLLIESQDGPGPVHPGIWTLFLADDWVLIRVDCEEYPIPIYKCDGIKGTRQCLEMIKKKHLS